MIRIREATTMAFTKLRTRKVRLIVTIVVSGLLFSLLAGASIVARGTFASIRDFSDEGFVNRYMVQAYPLTSGVSFNDPKIVDRAAAIHKDTMARKKAEAKRLGIEYSAEGEESPVSEFDTGGGNKQRFLNDAHPAARQAMAEHLAEHKALGIEDVQAISGPYQSTGYFQSRLLPYNLAGASLEVLKGGQESFDDKGNTGFAGPPKGIDSFVSSWTLMSSELLEPFILPGQSLALGKDGSIPVILPMSAAEEVLSLKSLPGTASSAERLERAKEVREKARSVTFNVCYRNDTSANLVREAIAVQQEIERNKTNKEYVKPSFQYGLPKEACGAVPVIRDVRTKDEKTLAAKQEQFNRTFGAAAPEQSTLTFRMVGIVPDYNFSTSVSVSAIISSLLVSSLGTGWFSPLEQASPTPLVDKLFSNPAAAAMAPPTYYAEFPSADAARRFMDEKSCQPDYASVAQGEDPGAECVSAGKPFSLSGFGSNSLGLEEATRIFSKVFIIAALIIAAIGCIILMGTVGKLIADSRRETAVFRAIGAKKLDIAQIYLLYTIFIALLIFVFAVILGFIGALVVHNLGSEEATLQALLAYNSTDLEKVFKLYSFYPPDMFYLLLVSLAAGLLSAVFPLIRSLRRNPIRDMRDDT